MLLTQACFFIVLLAVVMRAYDDYFRETFRLADGTQVFADGHEYRWLVMGLLGMFAVLAAVQFAAFSVPGFARTLQRRKVAWLHHAYVAGQAAIVTPLLFIEPGQDYFAILFFLLSYQAMGLFSLSTGYAWIAVFSLLTAAGLLSQEEGLPLTLLYVAGYYFFGIFAAATAKSERSRKDLAEAYSELAHRESELRESEERYRRLVEESPDAIVVLDENGYLADVNTRAHIGLGFERDDLIGRHVRDIYPPFELESFMETRGQLDATFDAQNFKIEDLDLRRKDGTVFPVEVHLARIEIDGRPHYLAIVRNVTERKEAEAALLGQTRELAVLEERNRMAREIHDTLAQGFTGIVLQLEAAEQALAGEPGAVATHLTSAKGLARDSLQDARRSVWALRPAALGAGTLEDAVRAEVGRLVAQGRRATFEVQGKSAGLPASVEAGLLRVCQEALTNVNRHAAAESIEVRLAFDDAAVTLSVCDNGAGFDVASVNGRGGLGLRGMDERVALLGGKLAIASQPGAGTRVEARVPLPPDRTVQA